MAVGYIAAHVGQARIGKGGEDGREPGHVGWLEFTHYTTRKTVILATDGIAEVKQDTTLPGDMNIHTHFLIPNAVFTESGRVGSLDTAAVPGLIDEAGGLYHARLAQNLRAAGFGAVLDHRTGAARIPTIPEEVCRLFSKRSNLGEALARKEAADQGKVWDAMSDAERTTRIKEQVQRTDQRKYGDKDDKPDAAAWRHEAKAAGWEPPKSFQIYGPELPPLIPEQRLWLAYETALPFLAEPLQHRAVITHHVARSAAFRGLIHAGMQDIGDADAVTALMRKEGVQQYGEQTALVWVQEPEKRHLSVTTELHRSHELEFIRLAQAAADRSGAIPAPLLAEKIAASGLDFSDRHGQAQREVIERVAAGGRLHVVVGSAGSGKTALLQVLVPAWHAQSRQVYGASLAWRQTDELAEAGIPREQRKAFSILLDGLKDGTIKPAPQSVVVVDELALLGTRQALELLREQARHGFTVVSIGDDKQCQAVEAGAIIELTRRALGPGQVPEILTTRRQETAREQQIASLLRDGRAAEALGMKVADGTVEIVPGRAEALIARTAKLYVERLAATGEAPTISTPTNSDAQQIAAAVRQERRKLGHVGPDLVIKPATDGEREYALALAQGDRVRLFKSTGANFTTGRSGSIGRNGSVLDVVAVTDRGLTLKGKSGNVGHVVWERLTDKKTNRLHLDYGDFMTVHSGQGHTSREHIFALPRGSQAVDGTAAYAASTRHKQKSYTLTSSEAERDDVRRHRPA